MRTSFIYLCFALFSVMLVNTSQAQNKREKQKTDITPLNNITDDLLRLEPVTYRYDKKQQAGPAQYGLIAEDVEKVFPQLVKTHYKNVPAGKNSYKSVAVKTIDYNSLIPLLLAAVKEQQGDIEKLKGQLQKLASI